jgi:hypothetical protein
MAGEESTVGGVTVQQYLAEVERTITDPTLTSTYEKLFKEAATVKQDLLYPYSFFEEDVMTAINPPKILQDNLKLILTVLQHLLHYLKN